MIKVNEVIEKLKGLVKSKSPVLSKLNLFMSKDKPPASASPVPKGPSRPMKYPYTFSAKIAQFPYKFYFQNNTIFRYYCYGVIAAVPVFVYISRLSNSPANKKKWAEIRRKEHEELALRFE
ncbi:uncharacterized protein LOC108917946 [Anoplophora glabripennis]|uniref:uncharacterized protein LOC108917946 n=1 Tax=Anoplophora glabripennis TaxID=217634 RepID=UPI000874C812|nr:uncharacterized protein LOC108917946 [Anoplophora glabripennis]